MKRYDLLSLCGVLTMIGLAACSDNENNNALVSGVDGYVNNIVVTVDNNRSGLRTTNYLFIISQTIMKANKQPIVWWRRMVMEPSKLPIVER